MRRLAAVLLLASCIGPTLVETREDETGKHGIVTFRGRDGIGYVDATVMDDRTNDALALARTFCDGGVDVVEKRQNGSDNTIDFKCSATAAAPKPCPDVPKKKQSASP